MHIAICDDDSIELTRIVSILDKYREERNIIFTYKTFTNATELLSTIKIGRYDLLLLDILMPGCTGIQAAHEIRTADKEVKIIFLTSSPEFALESYSIKAKDYILKPISKEKMFSALDDICMEEKEALDGLSIKTQNGMARILFSKIVLVEVMNKRLYFYLSDGSVREVHATLAEYEETLLSQQNFFKVHRSYIVNLLHISEITARGLVTQNGKSIPIARRLYGEVRQLYMEQLFLEAGVK